MRVFFFSRVTYTSRFPAVKANKRTPRCVVVALVAVVIDTSYMHNKDHILLHIRLYITIVSNAYMAIWCIYIIL